MTDKTCPNCKHSVPFAYGGYVCVHPDLLDNGVTLSVGQNETCCDWEEEEVSN